MVSTVKLDKLDVERGVSTRVHTSRNRARCWIGGGAPPQRPSLPRRRRPSVVASVKRKLMGQDPRAAARGSVSSPVFFSKGRIDCYTATCRQSKARGVTSQRASKLC